MATEEEEKIPTVDEPEVVEPEPEPEPEQDYPLKILGKLLSTEEHQKVHNRLIEDFKYDNEGSNGLFDAQPRVVKIAGFEINKKITMKVNIVNKSKFSERIIILPPTTPFFKIRYSKRGQIPPGLSEIIYLTFSPQNYQLYSDTIRINCPGDKIVIPINAYPRMNILVKEYIPKTFDLGNVTIDTSHHKEHQMKNLIDIPFNYTITPIKPVEEITLNPLESDVKAFSSRSIAISFKPKKYGFFRGEYEFRINEYDFTPYVFSVIGTCNTYGLRNFGKTDDTLFDTNESLLKKKSKNVNPKHRPQEEEEKNQEPIVISDPNQQHEVTSDLQKSKDGEIEASIPGQNEGEFETGSQVRKEGEIEGGSPPRKSREMDTSSPTKKDGQIETSSQNRRSKEIDISSPTKKDGEKESNSPNRRSKEIDISSPTKKDEEKESSSPNRRSKELETSSPTKKDDEEQEKNSVTRPTTSKALQKFKDFPSSKERDYLNYYNNADGVIQAKEFKYIPFIGKELLTQDETKKLLSDREDDLNNKIDTRCQLDKNRHQIDKDQEKCEVDRNNKYYLKPNFNSNQNDNFFKTRHYFKQLLKAITKVVIRKRAEKNMNQLKAMLDKNNIKSREDFKKYVDQNWIDYYSKDQIGADDETSFNFLKMKFLAPSFLFREQVYLTNEYSLDSLKQQITHENNINLEEYTEYEPLERNDLEVIGYNAFVSPGMTQFDVNLGEKLMRPGCESENLIRDERGDTEICFDKTSGLFEISDEHLKHIDFQPEDIIFNNPSLKRFVSFNPFTENSIDYNLQPRKPDFKEELITNYLNELYMKTNISYCDNGQINLKQIDNDYLLCDNTLNFLPKKLKAADQKDLNVKKGEKVDEDNYLYELVKEDENQLLDLFEKEDENIQKVRQLNKVETVNLKRIGKISMEKDLQMQKKKWMSTVPTMFEYFNSGITNPNNKFLL